MSTPGLFVLGALVTLIVGAALTLLIWGAILDGRAEAERRRAEAEPEPAPPLHLTTSRRPTTDAA